MHAPADARLGHPAPPTWESRYAGSEVRTMKHVASLREVSVSVNDRLNRIEARHRALDARIRELGRHAFLTPDERREVSELKKHKLRAKDEIAALRRTV